eukprot:CAMPEP_0179199290 /NCGR_PEP_ID=MMETSP0796-20121207/99147_1 /TAXON_ID=73915 /ORGANISM="Pyrodinium bahamense, Strain pbaha01" /LENGTH=51 /DNA_ID=CAMNT_0020903783 /DNA_START=12 /DNA_END=164 /DNA_ORIENTATION=-
MTLASTESSDRGHVVAGLLSWTACSVGMMVFNKEASRSFPASCTLVGLQMA